MISGSLTADLSLKETSVLSGAPEKSIRHELAARIARAGRTRGRRRFSPSEVVYFVLLNELPVGLDRTLRRELFELLASRKLRAGRWRREARSLVLEGQVEVVLAMDEVERRVEQRVGTFLRGRAKVVSRPAVLGGEPVFEGTRISVRFVGERARNGEPVAELLEDYPALTHEDVEFAKMYVALGRPPGRPRKRPRFVRG